MATTVIENCNNVQLYNYANQVSVKGAETGCKLGFIKGNGIKKTIKIATESFSRFKSSSSIDIDFYPSNEKVIEVTADENTTNLIAVKNIGDTLSIGYKDSVAFTSVNTVKVLLKYPQMPTIEFSGSSNLTINNLKQDSLKIIFNGSGRMRLNGIVKNLSIESNDSGKIQAKNLIASNVNVYLSGSGKIETTAIQTVTALNIGVGKIEINGNPKSRQIEVTKLGKIKFE
ncbi:MULTISPECIES: GIN domain-containing protein [Acinetobacter]|uniref:GIN domain-containing protein n=1 Tax=Acinetobacter TaxID=469 RepID=UPI000D00362C|nr:DUF2807 domain-containing protein [Acinetobacter sp. MYb10]QLD63057.1 DUF2807 domain-containing protein [Acinetobacter sp. MYb10]